MSLDCDFRAVGLLVRGGDAGKVLDLAGAGLFVEALGVALLGDVEGHVDEDLDKGDGVVVGRGRRGVQLTGEPAVGAVGRDEGCDDDGGRVGKELGDLWRAGEAARGGGKSPISTTQVSTLGGLAAAEGSSSPSQP